METFDKENYINNIFTEFTKTDEFYDVFRFQFIFEMKEITADYYPEFDINKEYESILKLYADEVLSTSESVIYKDKSYPDYRIVEELQIMSGLVVKEYEKFHKSIFIEAIHHKAKELIVRHYSEVFNLSANGFRLLEKYTLMYNWEFVTNFYGALK